MPTIPITGTPEDIKSAVAQDTLQGFSNDEDQQDYHDYCVASQAIEEALEKGGIKKTKDFAKELGFDF
jgi:hypothetical protein